MKNVMRWLLGHRISWNLMDPHGRLPLEASGVIHRSLYRSFSQPSSPSSFFFSSLSNTLFLSVYYLPFFTHESLSTHPTSFSFHFNDYTHSPWLPPSVLIWEPPTPVWVSSVMTVLKSLPTTRVTAPPPRSSVSPTPSVSSVMPPRTKSP